MIRSVYTSKLTPKTRGLNSASVSVRISVKSIRDLSKIARPATSKATKSKVLVVHLFVLGP